MRLNTQTEQQLRVNLLAMHRRIVSFGDGKKLMGIAVIALFCMVLVEGVIVTLAIPSKGFTYAFILMLFPFILLQMTWMYLHGLYFHKVPEARAFVAYFEENQPELCSWLDESAVIEATKMYKATANPSS